MTALKLFVAALTLTTCALLAVLYVNRPKHPDAAVHGLQQVTGNLVVTSQLKPENVQWLKDRGFKTIVDIRPDGEAQDQPSSSMMQIAAKESGLDFYYIPVPHENIPGTAVNVLHDVLSRQAGPTVMYCRTGRRAVRTFALVEASRVDGPSAEAILGMARDAGFSADDLRENIIQRIAHRNDVQEVKNDVR